MRDRLLQQAIEEQPSTARVASVEAEHRFIKIRLQMFFADGAVVGAHNPPFLIAKLFDLPSGVNFSRPWNLSVKLCG